MIKIDINSAYPAWATAAMQIFKDTLKSGNIVLCKSIYQDVLDAGHFKVAREMKQMLQDK